MYPRERRQSHVTSRFGLLGRELQCGCPRRVVTGLALRPSEAEDLIRLRLQEAEASRRFRGTADVSDGVVEPALDPGQLAEHRLAADVQPRVVELSQPELNLIARLDRAHAVTG